MITTTSNIPIIEYGDQEGPSGLLFASRRNALTQRPFHIQNVYFTEPEHLPVLPPVLNICEPLADAVNSTGSTPRSRTAPNAARHSATAARVGGAFLVVGR